MGVAYVNVYFLPMPSLRHIISRSQIRDGFVETAPEVVKVGGMYELPFDKYFLTNVFDNVEAVADGLGSISITQQPE